MVEIVDISKNRKGPRVKEDIQASVLQPIENSVVLFREGAVAASEKADDLVSRQMHNRLFGKRFLDLMRRKFF